jgi:hypothetical protein
MTEYFIKLDWDAFWLNFFVGLIFFILSIPLAIKLIPYFTIRQLQKKNKKYILRKTSYVIQEICEYLSSMPFKDNELHKYQIAIFTSKSDLKNHRFVGLVNIDILNPIVFPKVQLVVSNHLKSLTINEGFNLLNNEKERISSFREKLERIIEVHSLHLDEAVISNISELCLDIRSFEIQFEFNFAIDDLIEKGFTERIGVFGIMDLAKLYEKILTLLKGLIDKKHFETERKLKG